MESDSCPDGGAGYNSPLINLLIRKNLMTHSITIDFPSYEVMKTFDGSFEGIKHYFDDQQDDEGEELRNSTETWGKSRFSI